MTIQFTHHDFKKDVTTVLDIDKQGKVNIGQLVGIQKVKATLGGEGSPEQGKKKKKAGRGRGGDDSEGEGEYGEEGYGEEGYGAEEEEEEEDDAGEGGGYYDDDGDWVPG